MGHQAPAFSASTGLPKSSSGPQGSLFRGSLSWSGWLALSSCRGFRQTPEPGFLESKLLLEHREWVFHFGSDMSLGPLHPLCTVPSASSGNGGASQADSPPLVCHLLSLLQALVAHISIDHPLFFPMQELCCHHHITDMGRRGSCRLDQAESLSTPMCIFMAKTIGSLCKFDASVDLVSSSDSSWRWGHR